VRDDNGGANSSSFSVTVNNGRAVAGGNLNNLQVNEGQPFVLSNLGASTFNLA